MRLPVLLFLAAILAACSGTRTESPPATTGVELPVQEYEVALRRGDAVYRIDAVESLLTVRVYREGPLARLGHDHVIASRDLRGLAAWSADGTVARADLAMPISTLSIDDRQLRADAGFESQPSADDIEGTRANMIKSIDAEVFSDIRARAEFIGAEPDAARFRIEIDWHGVTQSFEATVELRRDANAFEVGGAFELRQSDFGIVPYSVFGGALSVADRLDVSFRLRGRRVEEGAVAAMLF